jgi:hypothetical protein
MRKAIRFFILIYSCFVTVSFAQDQLTEHTLKLNKGKKSESVKIEDIAWIAGHWAGEALGGWCEEVWSEPQAGAMMGMFRHIRENKATFYEFVMIAPKDSNLVMRVKHFNPDLTGWEEKDKSEDFPLVKVLHQTAYFDGLTYQKEGDDDLIIYLVFKQKDGNFREEKFRYKREK